MNRIRTAGAVVAGAWLAASSMAQDHPGLVDGPGLAAHNDVIYLSPARQGWEGMPLGNGTLGAQVWQPGGLMFQLNTPLSGVYGGALCRLHLRTVPEMLVGLKAYRQRLSLADATLVTDITTLNGPTRVECFVPAQVDGLGVRCRHERTGGEGALVEVETWRDAAQARAEGRVAVVTDTLKLNNEPDYRFAVALALDAADGAAEQGPDGVVRLRTRAGEFTLWAAVAGTRDPDTDVAALARARLDELAAQGWAAVKPVHDRWWADFWSRSFIRLSSDDGFADYAVNLWYMHLYAMGAGSRGEVPPKFNGGLWTHNRDQREWGSHYWHWNTQESYWPLFAANHLELHEPYRDMYWKMLPTVTRWTQACWELEGAQYQETIPFNGAMGVWEKERGVHPRVPIPKRVAHTQLILSSSAEIAMQFWWYYLYTGDEAFLRERAYPLMKAVAAFYVGYLEKDAEGRYNVWPSNAHESFWKVKNPATDLAALRYFFPAIIRVAEALDLDPDLCAVWRDRLDHLAPYPLDPQTGAILPYELAPGEEMIWRNAENPELFPIGVFPLIGPDSPDYELGLKTFRARRNVCGYGWNTDSIAAARLGLADAPADAPGQLAGLAALLRMHAERYQGYPCGLQDYYSRKPAMHFYLEGSGTFATALGEMLLQSWDGAIRLCPALPAAWDADFKLLAMGGIEVTAHAEKGRTTHARLVSQRGGPVAMVNPFGVKAEVTQGGRTVLASEEKMLRFPTEAGQTYLVAPAGRPVPDTRVTAEPNTAPKPLTAGSSRRIGKPESAWSQWVPPVETNAPAPPPLPADWRRAPMPVAHPARFAQAPTIDGRLDEASWRSAESLGPFFLLGQDAPATEQTDVRVGYDEQALYVGIVCWESQMSTLMVEYAAGPETRDADVFQDDSVEIFLQSPFGLYWHLAVNALGAAYDSRGGAAAEHDRRMNSGWTVAAMRWGNRWIVEAAVPFTAVVPLPPQGGDAWGFNVGRNQKPRGETSTWAPLRRAAFHTPEEFGRLSFTEGWSRPPVAAADPELVGHWTFDETSASWAPDVSGHGHYGFLTTPMNLVTGRVGRALQLTGAGFVDIASSDDLNLADAMTLALWVRPATMASMRLIDKGPAGGADAYLLDTHPENNLRVIVRGGALMAAEAALPVGQWSHVAATLGGGTLRIYLNGRVVSAREGVSPITPTALPLRLGADSGGLSRFVGLMDDVRVYRKTLTPEEIEALASAED